MKFYDSKQAGLGNEFLEGVARSISLIRRFPESAASISQRSRRCRLRRLPYGLIYQIRDGDIAILATMDLHREPGYWIDRET